MKKIIFASLIISVILSLAFLAGCVRVDLREQAGPITTRQYSLSDFTGIDVGYAFEVEIIPSDNYSVTITAGENSFENINVYKSGSTLVVDVDNWFVIWFVTPKLTVTMPVLTELELSGASKSTAIGFRSPHDLKLHLSGASQLDMDIEAGDFFAELSGASKINGRLISSGTEIELSGASSVSLTGSGGNINLHGSGASRADMVDFTVNNAYIDLSGASHARLDINGRLEVDLSGASSLEYKGSPSLGEIDLSGASSIEPITSP